MPDTYPLPSAEPASLGFAATPLQHLDRLIRQHIEEGRYPGAQIALARHGKLALFRSYGDAKTDPERVPAGGETLFLLFSQTKVLTSAAVWALIEEGKRHLLLRAPIALYMPVRLLHGLADESVPWQLSLRLAERLASRDVAVTLVKDGDHRLSSEPDLARLAQTLDALIGS